MTETTKTQTTKTYSPCYCGCGFLVSSKSLYKQGHDAKHVSVLLSYVVAGTHTVDEAKAQLPSTALQVKLHNALARYTAKAEAKQAKQQAKGAKRTKKFVDPEQCDRCGETVERDDLYVVAGGPCWCNNCHVNAKEIKIGRWVYPIVEISGEEITYTKRDGSIASSTDTNAVL